MFVVLNYICKTVFRVNANSKLNITVKWTEYFYLKWAPLTIISMKWKISKDLFPLMKSKNNVQAFFLKIIT